MNVVVVLGSGAFALIALIAPAANPGIGAAAALGAAGHTYAALYGTRGLALMVALIAVAIADRYTGPRRLVPLLLLNAAVQAADAIIGLTTTTPGMIAGGTMAAVVHLGSAWLLRTDARR